MIIVNIYAQAMVQPGGKSHVSNSPIRFAPPVRRTSHWTECSKYGRALKILDSRTAKITTGWTVAYAPVELEGWILGRYQPTTHLDDGYLLVVQHARYRFPLPISYLMIGRAAKRTGCQLQSDPTTDPSRPFLSAGRIGEGVRSLKIVHHDWWGRLRTPFRREPI